MDGVCIPIDRVTVNFEGAYSSDDLFCTLSLEITVRFEESHWDMFKTYWTLSSFCTLNYSRVIRK